jgi:hypothetical protein
MTAGQGPYGNPAGQGGSSGEPEAQGWGAPQEQPQQGQPQYGQPPYGQPQHGQPQQGQPQYGQPQQGQSPYGQSPYGQPPYGQPQYPGYGPAPSAPTGYGAPRPVDRPVTVRAGIGAFVASIVFSLVAQAITRAHWDTLVDPATAFPTGEGLSEEEAEFTASLMSSMGTVSLVIGLVSTAVFALFVWFAWRGHNWARIVLWILGGLDILAGLFGVLASGAMDVPTLPVLTALGWFEVLADVVAVVLLAMAASSEWYRYRGWLRATGQPG